jgi:hypothetical protein
LAAQIDAVAGHLPIGGEGHHRHAGLARDRRYRDHRFGIERSQDQRGAALDRILDGRFGAIRSAFVILDDQLDGALLALEQGQLRRLLEVAGDDAGRTLAGQRHEQGDLGRGRWSGEHGDRIERRHTHLARTAPAAGR